MYPLLKFIAEGQFVKAHDIMYDNSTYFVRLSKIYDGITNSLADAARIQKYRYVRKIANKIMDEGERAMDIEECIKGEIERLSKMKFMDKQYIYFNCVIPASQDISEIVNKKFIDCMRFLKQLSDLEHWEDIEELTERALVIKNNIDKSPGLTRKRSYTWQECAANLASIASTGNDVGDTPLGAEMKYRLKTETPKTKSDIIWKYYIERLLGADVDYAKELAQDVFNML
nr:hypothetical protein K-LCC10_0401 [Kaumoebavirus]